MEQLQKELVQKQNQIINVKQVSAAVFAQFNSLRSEISSARRAQIDMRRTMQNELQQVQASIITMIEDYEVTQVDQIFTKYFHLANFAFFANSAILANCYFGKFFRQILSFWQFLYFRKTLILTNFEFFAKF